MRSRTFYGHNALGAVRASRLGLSWQFLFYRARLLRGDEAGSDVTTHCWSGPALEPASYPEHGKPWHSLYSGRSDTHLTF
jgi:hypothetical protein